MANYTFPAGARPVLGAYFNMARLNFCKTILNIFSQTGLPSTFQEDGIHDVLRKIFVLNNGDSRYNDEREQYKADKVLKLRPEQQVKMQRLLFHHFPVLGPITADSTDIRLRKSKKDDKQPISKDALRGVSFADCMKGISDIAECLKNLRNFYTHANPYNTPEQLRENYWNQGQIAIWLEKAFDASRRRIKTRDNLSDQDMKFLTGHGFNDRMKCVEDKEHTHYDKKLKRDVNDIRYVEKEDFYYRIRATKANPVKSDDADELTVLSDFGTLYFCSLFLSMDYVKKLLNELKLFDMSPFRGDKMKTDIIFNMICLYRIRVPRGIVFDSEDDVNALALDILNELRRCPKELYDVLEEQGQEAFNQYETDGHEWDADIVRMIRHTDRFPQLVMKYIDLKRLFHEIRFQVSLGKFRFRFYDKQCVDGNPQVRSLQKEINGFGRLDEIERERKKQYADMIQAADYVPTKLEHEQLYLDIRQFEPDTADSKPYITDHKASYNIHANRIGLWWEEGKSMYLPELKVEDGKAKVLMPAPIAEISVRDFPAMMFYHYLLSSKYRKGKYDSIENIVKRKTDSLKQFFTDVHDGRLVPYDKDPNMQVAKQNEKDLKERIANDYRLAEAEIPEKLWGYLFHQEGGSQEKFRKSAIAEAQRRYFQAIMRKKHFVEDRKKLGTHKAVKYGKKGYHDVRHGKLAEYLVKSIMAWTPVDAPARRKLTGLNYSKLQAFLATYGSAEGPVVALFNLRRILENACLVNKPASEKDVNAIDKQLLHPFLEQVVRTQPVNIETLYLNYLDAEVAHFSSLFAIEAAGTEKAQIIGLKQSAAWSSVPFVHAGRDKWKFGTQQYYQELAGKYVAEGATILLPDGLFTQPIRSFMEKELGDNEEMKKILANDSTANNAACLITSFFRLVENDDNQPYYYTTQPGNSIGKPKFARRYELFEKLNYGKPKEDKVCPHGTVEEIAAVLKPAVEENLCVIGKKGKTETEEQGNVKHVKVISQIIDRYISDFTPKQRFADLEAEKERARAKLNRLLRDMKNNERTIRRYKTQDIILFLMAKSILSSITDKNNRHPLEHLKLHDICNDAKSSALNDTFDFEHTFSVTINVPVKNGENEDGAEEKPKKREKITRKFKLVQKGMTLKNYGRFYRFLNDDRLKSLLQELYKSHEDGVTDSGAMPVIENQLLGGEFSNYDGERIDVFRVIQGIEHIAGEKLAEVMKDAPDNDEMLKTRDSFSGLLKLLEDQGQFRLTQTQANMLIEIRNAFGHNRYPEDVLAKMPHLPEVAVKVRERISEILKNANIIIN